MDTSHIPRACSFLRRVDFQSRHLIFQKRAEREAKERIWEGKFLKRGRRERESGERWAKKLNVFKEL